MFSLLVSVSSCPSNIHRHSVEHTTEIVYITRTLTYLYPYHFSMTSKYSITSKDELLCGVSGTLTVEPNTDHEFTQLCSLLSTGEITKSDGTTVNFQEYLSETVDEDKGHTLFAPTDAAFDAIGLEVVDALLDDTSDVDSQIRDDLIARWMELQILPDSYLLDAFSCNQNYFAYNPSNFVQQQQIQKTRCAGTAGTFEQIGGGNVGELEQPTVGAPEAVFGLHLFPNTNNPVTMVATPDDSATGYSASSNLITCNGVVHVVDIPLRPGVSYGYYGSKGAKGYGYYSSYYPKTPKGFKGYPVIGTPAPTSSAITSFFGPSSRALGEEGAEEQSIEEPASEADAETNRENRRARLESLLVDANGNFEAMD